MILDEIISLVFALIYLIIEGLSLLLSFIINMFIALIELILDLFGKKRSIKRVKRFKRRKNEQNHNEYNHLEEQDNPIREYTALVCVLVAVVIAGFVFIPRMFPTHKDITFVATDGNKLPFASVIVYHNGQQESKRTDNQGNLRVEKSGLEKITMNDKRYKKTTWQTVEIDDVLVVKRSLLGTSLDILADKILKKDT